MSTLINFIEPEYNKTGEKIKYKATRRYQVEGKEIEKTYIFPEVSIDKLRKIADTIGYCIIPLEYTHFSQFLKKYTEATSENNQLKLCYNTAKDYFTGCFLDKSWYMLAPINFYNIWEVINSFEIRGTWLTKNLKVKEIKEVYFSKQLSVVELMLNLLMPSLRKMQQLILVNNLMINDIAIELERTREQIQNTLNQIIVEINYLSDCIDEIDEYIINLEREMDGTDFIEIAPNIEVPNIYERPFSEPLMGGVRFEEAKYRNYYNFLEENIPFLTSSIVFFTKKSEKICTSNDNAILVSCFGADLSEKIFIDAGLTSVNDEIFDSINLKVLQNF